jgi:hypothetical protein
MKDLEQLALKTSPAIGGYVLYDFTLNEWVAIVTILYVLLQIGLLLPKYYNLIKKWIYRE